MHYYIDGYNWLFRIPKNRQSLEERRRIFIQEIHKLVLDHPSLVTLVFDSADPSKEVSSKGNFKSLEIIFTPKKQTADEYIENAVELSKKPQNITVVTLDRQLQEKCRIRGARVLTMEEFYLLFAKKKRVQKEKSYFELPAQTARLLRIFEKKWLDDLSDD